MAESVPTTLKLIPIGDRILVEPIKEHHTKSGLIIPDTASVTKEKPLKGTILAVGETVTDFNLGQVVQYGKYSGHPLVVEGKDCLILRGDDVLLIWE